MGDSGSNGHEESRVLSELFKKAVNASGDRLLSLGFVGCCVTTLLMELYVTTITEVSSKVNSVTSFILGAAQLRISLPVLALTTFISTNDILASHKAYTTVTQSTLVKCNDPPYFIRYWVQQQRERFVTRDNKLARFRACPTTCPYYRPMDVLDASIGQVSHGRHWLAGSEFVANRVFVRGDPSTAFCRPRMRCKRNENDFLGSTYSLLVSYM